MSADLQKLAAAKLWIVSAPPEGASRVEAPRGLPYLAHALYALVPVPTTRVRRMTCDASWRVYVNPDWLAAAEVPEIGRELAHVTWHLLGDHAGRARSLGVDHSTRRAWLLAADISVADTAGPDLRPDHLADPEETGYERGLAAEQYFAVEQLLSATDDSSWEDSATPAGDDDPSPDDGDRCGSGADGLRRAWDLPAAAEVDVTTLEGTPVASQDATQLVGSALRIAPAFIATTVDADLGVSTAVTARYVASEGRYVIKGVTNTAIGDDVELNYPTVAKVGMQAIVQTAAPRCIFLTLDDESDPLAHWISVDELTTSQGRMLPPQLAAEVVRRGSSEARMQVIELLYGSAALAGLPPAKLIQAELGVPHRTASSWIIAARAAGRLVGMNYNAGRPAGG